MSNYTIQVTDIEGYEVYALELDFKRAAISHAKLMARDLELVAAGASKVEVIDETGYCVYDEVCGSVTA